MAQQGADPLGFTGVMQQEDGTWTFRCPRSDCDKFVSSRWPTKKSAVERGREHMDEHDEGDAAIREGRAVDRSKLMTRMHSWTGADGKRHAGFLEKHGLTLNDDGSVSA